MAHPGRRERPKLLKPPARRYVRWHLLAFEKGPERRRDRGCCGGAASLCVGCACARDTSRRDDRRLGRGPRTARCRRAVRPWAVGVPCAGLFAAMGDPGAVAALRAELDAERAFSAQLAARVKAQVRRSRHEAHARALREVGNFAQVLAPRGAGGTPAQRLALTDRFYVAHIACWRRQRDFRARCCAWRARSAHTCRRSSFRLVESLCAARPHLKRRTDTLHPLCLHRTAWCRLPGV